MILLTNTLSGKKEPFQSLQKNKVSLYVCGITPYDYAHIGHGRCYIMFDILYRLLKIEGYEVSYCRNYTDIDDKLLNRAEQELGNRLLYKDIAKKYIDAFQEEMRLLNNEIPDYEPRVTHVIPDIRAFIQRLIDNGYAYKVEEGDVYYSVKKSEQYGQLSKRNLENLLVLGFS
jgi:cysteinyl-tRNA synthetase